MPDFIANAALREHSEYALWQQSIAEDPARRIIYADWLDEHDEPEEANRMRQYEEAMAWFDKLAADFPNPDWPTPEHEEEYDWQPGDTKEPRYRVDVTREWLIALGNSATADTDHQGGYASVGDREDLQQRLYEEGVKAAFWHNWEIVTGIHPPHIVHNWTSFGCAC